MIASPGRLPPGKYRLKGGSVLKEGAVFKEFDFLIFWVFAFSFLLLSELFWKKINSNLWEATQIQGVGGGFFGQQKTPHCSSGKIYG